LAPQKNVDFMSQWSRKMMERASLCDARARRRNTGQLPLRKVVGYGPHPNRSLVMVEFLECGHYMLPRRDMFGETLATRRRCRKCGRAA
jgi:hypothetical protein